MFCLQLGTCRLQSDLLACKQTEMHYPFSTSDAEYEAMKQVLQWNYGFMFFITCFGFDETTVLKL